MIHSTHTVGTYHRRSGGTILAVSGTVKECEDKKHENQEGARTHSGSVSTKIGVMMMMMFSH